MKTKHLLGILLFIFIFSIFSTAMAEDEMAKRWSTMTERERQSYALAVRDTLAVMCMMTSDGQKDYIECVKQYVSNEDMPGSLFAVFDDAYKKRLYRNVSPEVLLYIWTQRDKRDIKQDLKKAEQLAKESKK